VKQLGAQELGADMEQVREKLVPIIHKLWLQDSVEWSVLVDLIWDLVYLHTEKSLGLHISRGNAVCVDTSGKSYVEDLLTDLEDAEVRCSRDSTALYRLCAKTHTFCEITAHLCQGKDAATDKANVVLDEAFFALKEPLKIFVDKNCGADEWSEKDKSWAEEILGKLLTQRVSGAASHFCLDWVQQSTAGDGWKDHFDLRRRFLLLGTLFGEEEILKQVKEMKDDADMTVGAVRALQDLNELKAFQPQLLAEGLQTMLTVPLESAEKQQLYEALVSAMGTFASGLQNSGVDLAARACERILEMSSSRSWRGFSEAALMHETSWALTKIIKKWPCLVEAMSKELSEEVANLSRTIRNKYRNETEAVKYANDLEGLIAGRAS